MYRNKTLKELAQLDDVNPIQVQYGCSGRYFGISVRDGGGSLSRARALEYLMRAKTGSLIEDKSTGAGLGLISVLKSVSKLVFNLDPDSSTEVVGLFDMELFARGKMGARSLHLFTETPDEEADEEPEVPVLTRTGGNGGKWAIAAVLLAIASAMGTAVYMRETSEAQAQSAAATYVTVQPTPADATITLDGAEISAGTPQPLPQTGGPALLQVKKPGFETFTRELTHGSNWELHPRLDPEPTTPTRRGRSQPR